MHNFSKKIVTLVIILNSAFTAVTLYIFAKTSHEPTALIAAWFGFTTGELWLLARIKRTKLTRGDSDDTQDSSN